MDRELQLQIRAGYITLLEEMFKRHPDIPGMKREMSPKAKKVWMEMYMPITLKEITEDR